MTLFTHGTGRTPQRRILAGLALAAGAALTLSACSTGAAGDTHEGALRVVATTTQLTDFAGEVGGDDIKLTGLLPAGGSAHHFDPTPADLLALSEADVLIVNGAGLEAFIDDAIDASGFDGKLITASDGIDLAEAEEISGEGSGGEGAEHDHAEDGHSEADEADEAGDEHDHDHGPVNPHLWTSPRNAAGMVETIATGLAAADPAHAADFEQRAADYANQLTELDTWIAAQFAAIPEADRVLVSGHDSLRYYLHDYDIAFAGSLLPSFEDNAEPSAADIDALVAAIKEQGVRAVFVESSMSPKLARTIAKEAGVEVVDAESLYADSLGAPGSGADTYVTATINNTRVILEAWGATPAELPATLQ